MSKQTKLATASSVAQYVKTIEQKLGRTVNKTVALPGGGIELFLTNGDSQTVTNEADLVDMS